MAKHTQTIRQLLPTNCLSVFDHFVGLALKELMSQKNLFSKVASSKPVVLPQNRAPPNMFHKFA